MTLTNHYNLIISYKKETDIALVMEDVGGFAVCPYNPEHRVPRLRIQYHIVKCQAKYPKIEICPYNATHRLSKQDMRAHIQVCPSKETIFPEDRPAKAFASLSKPKPILQKEYLPETDPNHEMWDDV